MLITILRTHRTADGIFGTLSIDIDPFKCMTLENKALAIPPGVYDLLFAWSEHFQQIMPHVIVQGRTHILVHWANYPVGPDPLHPQLEGCTALGTAEELSADCIDQSKDAWKGFVQAISDQPSIKIMYIEDYGATETA